MNPYHRYVSELARLLGEGRRFPLGGFPIPPRAPLADSAPRALIFSPHPDDECIIGALALRLTREAGMRVVNVAVTQGSNKARQAARLEELKAACEYLGFDLLQTAPAGLESINVKTRTGDPAQWRASVEAIAAIVADRQPQVVFFPHDTDWNSTHVGTHYLLMDARVRPDLRPRSTAHRRVSPFWCWKRLRLEDRRALARALRTIWGFRLASRGRL